MRLSSRPRAPSGSIAFHDTFRMCRAIALQHPVGPRRVERIAGKVLAAQRPSARLSVYAAKYCRRFAVCRLSVTWSEWYCERALVIKRRDLPVHRERPLRVDDARIEGDTVDRHRQIRVADDAAAQRAVRHDVDVVR